MTPIQEEKRLKALDSYAILNTLEEPEYDAITQLASGLCNCPIALISLLDSEQEFFKSHYGLNIHQTPVEGSFCEYLINHRLDYLEVEDAKKDSRFNNFSLLKGKKEIRFYAGVALKTSDDFTLGTLCVLDIRTRKLSKKLTENLKILAAQVTQLLELRKAKFQLKTKNELLNHEKNWLNNIIEATQVGTWEWNVQTGEVSINERYAEIVGYTLEELTPINITTWYRLIHPEDAPLSDQRIQDCLDKKADFYNIECRLIHKNGSIVWINDRGKVVEWDENGKPLLMIGTHTDVTERKNIEGQFKTISDNIPGIVFCYHRYPNGKEHFSSISRGAKALLGFPAEEIKENSQLIWQRCDKKDLAKLKASLKISAKNLSPWKHEWSYHQPNGKLKWLKGNGNPKLQDDGSVVWNMIVTDISKQKDAEIQLKINEKRYRALVQEGADMTAILDMQGNYKHLSGNYLSITGYDPKELLGKNGFDFFHPDDVEKIQKEYQKLGEEKRVNSSPYRFLKKDGSYCWMQSVGTNLLEDPNIEGVIVNSIEITTLIQTQKKLQQHIERFEYVNKATNDAIYEYNIKSEKIYWGESFERIFGHPIRKNQFKLRDWEKLLHPKEREKTVNSLKKALNDKHYERWEEEYRLKKADGSYAHVEELGYILRDSEGTAVKMIGVLSDISLRKEEEEQLKLMQYFVNNTHDGVLITEAFPLKEPGPKIIYSNPAFSEMTGYGQKELIGKSPRMLQGPKTSREELNRLNIALKKNQAADVTLINYKKNGEKFWVNFSISPIKNDQGKTTHFMAIERDVTQRKQEEEKKQLQEEISQFFNQESTLEHSLQQTVKKILTVHKASFAEIWMVSNDYSQLILAAADARDKKGKKFLGQSKFLHSVGIKKGIMGRSVQKSQSVLWDQLSEKKTFLRGKAADNSKIKSVFALPLMSKDQLVGSMVLGSKKNKKKLEGWHEQMENLKTTLGAEIERKRIEEEFQNLFRTAPDIICILGKEGSFQKVNHAAEEILEYSEKELLGKHFINFVHPEDKTNTIQRFKNIISGNHSNNFENRYITKSGKIKWLSWSTTSPQGKQNQIYAVAKDVTEKKELKTLLSSAVRQAKIGSWSIDLTKSNNPPIYCSPIIFEILETDDSFQPKFKDGFGVYLDSYQEEIRQAIINLIKNGKSYDLEIPILTKKNNLKWVRSMGHGEFINNRCVKIYGSIQDIDQRKTAKIKLEEAFKEKNAILESIRDAFLVMDSNFKITYYNREAENIFQLRPKQAIGEKLWDIHPHRNEVHFYTHYLQALKEGKKTYFEEYYSKLNKWFEVSIYPSEKRLSVYYKDISERKEAEKKLVDSNERFEKVSEATQDAIWDWVVDSDQLYWGKGYQELFDLPYSNGFVKLNTWQEHLHPEDLTAITNSLKAALRDHGVKQWQKEYRFRKNDGSYAHVIDRGIILRDQNGNAYRMLGALSDISYRVEYESKLKQLNHNLEKQAKELAESNDELEQFAHIASHDLQEPLRMVSSFLSLLEKKYSVQLDSKALQYIDFAVDGADRMRQIILDLLEYSRIGKQRDFKEKVALDEVVKEVMRLQHKLISEKNAQIIFDNLPMIVCSKAPLLRIIHNLVNNALKYSKKDIAPKIRVKARKLKTAWEISVADNGMGIGKEFYEKIFIIFQRLHRDETLKGTGMGLAIVKKTVERLGGEIRVKSEKEKGSTFIFTLPFVEESKHEK